MGRTHALHMENARKIYGFSYEAREFARERADGACEFPGEVCPSPNTGTVNHLTGCCIAYRLELDPESITDPEQNALMLCEDHQEDLDNQEHVLLETIMKAVPKRKKRK